MSNEILNAAWQVSGLRPAEKLVLVRLADRANSNGKCWPSLDGIAHDCGINRATVIRAIKQLERLEYIEIDRGGGRRVLNQYQVLNSRRVQPFQDEKQSQDATPISRRMQQKNRETVASCRENGRTMRPEPSDNPHTDSTHRKPGESRARVNGSIDEPKKQGKRTVPEDWQPPAELRAELEQRFPAVAMCDEIERFRDYSRANDKRFKNFDAAFRNWIRKAADFAKRDGKVAGGASRRYLD